MSPLDLAEVRVLGALIEKEATTPEYYPLSLNALVNACNQKSNRDPVVDFDEDTVADALEGLRARGFALIVKGSGRVEKYAQRISETLNMGRRELAVLGVLLLRGPQTLGEIKDRSERSYSFADLDETERVLEKLSEWPDSPLVRKLTRQPGQKEARYIQLLSGEPHQGSSETGVSEPTQPVTRIGQLETQIHELRIELDELRRRFDLLEAQFR